MSSTVSQLSLRARARMLLRYGYFELLTHLARRKQARKRPCVVIFPSSQPWSSSSNLRAWLVAPELEKLGWRVIVVPEPLALSQRRRILKLEKPDVVLIQQTRHPLNQPGYYAPYPCVLDADDADFLDPRYQEMIAQAAKDAELIVAGSRYVAELLGQFNRRTPDVIWTCTPRPTAPPATRPADRAPIVAWAHEVPLRFPLEAALIQKVMIEVGRRTRCTFWLFGTEPPDAVEWFAPIEQTGCRCVALPRMPYEAYLAKVAGVAVGLQPVCLANDFSRGRSFGKILAYLSGQVAVIASNVVDHPCLFRNGENGYLVSDTVDEWASAIVRLLEDTELRSHVALAGWNSLHERLTTDTFARLMDGALRKAANSR